MRLFKPSVVSIRVNHIGVKKVIIMDFMVISNVKNVKDDFVVAEIII